MKQAQRPAGIEHSTSLSRGECSTTALQPRPEPNIQMYNEHGLQRFKGRWVWLSDPILASNRDHFVDSLLALPCALRNSLRKNVFFKFNLKWLFLWPENINGR